MRFKSIFLRTVIIGIVFAAGIMVGKLGFAPEIANNSTNQINVPKPIYPVNENDPPEVDTKKVAEEYLKNKGYYVLSHLKPTKQPISQTYKLSKELLVKSAFAEIWYLQLIHPNDFLGKTIFTEAFEVNNHPLDSYRLPNNGHIISKNKTICYVLVVDGQAIGGYAYPIFEYDDPKNRLFGFSWFSLEGKRINEIKPNNDLYLQGKSYDKWLEDWLGYSRKTIKSETS